MTTRTEPTPQHTPTPLNTAELLEKLQEIDENAEWNNLESSAVFTPEEYGEIAHRVTIHAALVEALEGLLWPNVPSREDVAILAVMSNAGPEVMALVDKIGTAQEKGREALAAAKVTP